MTDVGTYTVYGGGVPVVEDAPASRAMIIYTRLVVASVPARMVRTDGLMPVLVAEYDPSDLAHGEAPLSGEANFSPMRWGYALGQIEAMGGLHPLGPKDAAEFAMLTGDKPLHFQWTEFEHSKRPEGPPRVGPFYDPDEDDELECPYTPECEISEEYCCNGCASGLGPCFGPGLHPVCLTHRSA